MGLSFLDLACIVPAMPRRPRPTIPDAMSADEEDIIVRAPEAVVVKKPRTKLNDDLIRRIAGLLEDGHTIDATCDFLCISSSSFYTWIRRGAKYLEGDCKPREWAVFGSLALTVRRSYGRYRIELVNRLHNAGTNWYKYMSILERRDRRNFGRNAPAGGTDDEYQPDERFL